MGRGTPRRRLIPLAALAVVTAAVATSAATAHSTASTIKVAVLSDCQGAFGSFDGQDLAGVVAAMSQYAGAKPVDPNNPRKGWTGGQINGHPVKLVGIGCSNDKADTAIKETKRLMEQLGADVLIGPLSGDESIAVANYAKQHPTKTFVDGSAGPLDTTDYSSYAQQMPTNVDGTFVAVGGAGLIPFLKAYEQAHGPIDGKKFIGNLFWGTPGQFEQLSTRVVGAYVGGAGTAGDLATPAAKNYSNNIVGKWFKTIPPYGPAAGQASSTFTYGYFINTWGLIKGLQAVKGDISGGQSALQAAVKKVVLPTAYGTIHLDANNQGVIPVYYAQLYTKGGKLAVKTVGYIPNVDQTFGGTFSASTPAPGRTSPACVKRSLPWIGKTQHPKVTG